MSTEQTETADKPTNVVLVALAWLIVVIPLAYGLWETFIVASQLLGG